MVKIKDKFDSEWLNIGIHCGFDPETNTNKGSIITSDVFVEEILPYYLEYKLKFC